MSAGSQVIAQIESSEALLQFDAILDVADGIMVSRANMGMRMTAEKVGTECKLEP